MSKVVTLDKAAPEKALEGLNRLTGLVFESWPESLVRAPAQHLGPSASTPTTEAQLARRTGSQ